MRRLPLSLSILAFAPVSLPAQTADGPSFACSAAEGSVEEMICADADLSRLDRLVATRYRAALEVARGVSAGAAEAEADLRATQRGWIKGRNECWKSEDMRDCVSAAYLLREGALVATWMLDAPREVVFWTCGGNPANEVVTAFFDTQLPSIRFERGDTVDVGSLERTASGAKYAGSAGRYIWIKGTEATYRDPDPDGTTYTCLRRPG